MAIAGQLAAETRASSTAARLANRMDQATNEFLETFPFFAALVLAAHFTNRDGLLTVWGAHLYFWARLGYLLAAVLGYGLIRSAVFWNTALAGMVLYLVALLASTRTPNQAMQLTAAAAQAMMKDEVKATLALPVAAELVLVRPNAQPLHAKVSTSYTKI